MVRRQVGEVGEELVGIQLWAAGGATEPVILRTLGPGPLGFAFALDGERLGWAPSAGVDN
ncbi:hypothetical protein ABNF97_18380 [Plantactinospora sp. B6F1]|uniref:hypothetical protein n=1 Tax=Plantactinospora sp. B6F1 TaxID=3158971 RepID=UPI0013EF5812